MESKIDSEKRFELNKRLLLKNIDNLLKSKKGFVIVGEQTTDNFLCYVFDEVFKEDVQSIIDKTFSSIKPEPNKLNYKMGKFFFIN